MADYPYTGREQTGSLFLSGVPGESEAVRVVRFNKELEKHFVVVIWKQRGCGKSYSSIKPRSALTADNFHDLMVHTVLAKT